MTTDKKLVERAIELAKEGRSYREVASILAREGFKSKQGVPLDQKWVTMTLHLARKQGKDVPKRSPRQRRFDGAGDPIDLKLVRTILDSTASDKTKISMLRALFEIPAVQLAEGDPEE